MDKTIEKSVAETLLQKSMQVEIGGVTYEVAPPSTATLVLISEFMSGVPNFGVLETEEDVLKWVLKNARQCGFVGELVATLILGARRINETTKVNKKTLFGLLKYGKKVSLKSIISKESLLLHPTVLSKLIADLLNGLDVGSFFFTITFLNDINLTKPTKTKVIASGQ